MLKITHLKSQLVMSSVFKPQIYRLICDWRSNRYVRQLSTSTAMSTSRKRMEYTEEKKIGARVFLKNHNDISSAVEDSRKVSHKLIKALHYNLVNCSPQSMQNNFYKNSKGAKIMVDMKTTNMIIEFERRATIDEKYEFLRSMCQSDVVAMLQFYGDRLRGSEQNRRHLRELKQFSCQLVDSFDSKSLLKIADVLYKCDCEFVDFMRHLISACVSRWKSLDYKPEEIPQLMFYIMIYGETSGQLMNYIEEMIVKCLSSYSLQQLNIICNGFFRCNSRIKSQELLDGIAEKVLNELDTIDLMQLTPFLKVFRHAGFHNVNFFERVASHLLNQKLLEKETNLTRIMELMRSYASLRIYNQNLLESTLKVFQRLIERDTNTELVRSKDIASYLWGYSLFSSELDRSTCDLVCEQLRRRFNAGEFNSFPESLVTALTALAYLDSIPVDLVNQLFSSSFLNRLAAAKFLDKKLQLILLHSCMIIENPSYNGFLLPKNFLQTCNRNNFGYLPIELSRRKGMNVLFGELKRLFNAEEKVRCHFILPHILTAGIEIHLDEDNRPVPIQYYHCHDDLPAHIDWLSSVTGRRQGNNQKLVSISGDLIKNMQTIPEISRIELDDNCRNGNRPIRIKRKIAIDILGWHQVAFNHKDITLANTRLKHRHLQKLGYDLHVISSDEGQLLEELPAAELEHYVQEKIIDRHKIQL
ncbi:FAST kinase domain-containing protein 5, mitochondrial-like [Tubulanus polymorphus]|uniref:FAST kinase domain-containing protein 5, mitochondrial-like n=1 Tax=Tubulanus polymorphus TaxID=672921 RepID=UPI003DA1D455